MLNRWLWKIIVGLCFALTFGILAVVTVEAQTVEQDPAGSECGDCHEITEAHWSESSHAHSYDNPEFQKEWRKENSPPECLECHASGQGISNDSDEPNNVSCSVCHGPDPGDHPEKIMPTDISSRLCGTCHNNTHAEWKDSGHGKENLLCVRCHNPHTTELRSDGVQELCQSCHNDVTHFYGESIHAEEGLLCSDCHLRISKPEEGPAGNYHIQRVHTFTVDLESCSQCHQDDMHYPAASIVPSLDDENEVKQENGEPTLSLASAIPLNQQPDPVSPFGFAVLASLVGMGFGIVIAPWLEKWNRQARNEGKKDEQ